MNDILPAIVQHLQRKWPTLGTLDTSQLDPFWHPQTDTIYLYPAINCSIELKLHDTTLCVAINPYWGSLRSVQWIDLNHPHSITQLENIITPRIKP